MKLERDVRTERKSGKCKRQAKLNTSEFLKKMKRRKEKERELDIKIRAKILKQYSNKFCKILI